jgi:FkbM family methyltransferase
MFYELLALLLIIILYLIIHYDIVIRIHDSRVFYDENGNYISHKNLERDEQITVLKHVNKNDKVLELGARYGTVTALLIDCTGSEMNVVSIEPDKSVFTCLQNNLKNNKFKSPQLFNGVVGSKKMKMSEHSGYGTQTVDCSGNTCDVENLTYDEIQERYNITFDTIVADCEGCLPDVINHIEDFSFIKKIIFEKDYDDENIYEPMINKLEKNNFRLVKDGFINIWKK